MKKKLYCIQQLRCTAKIDKVLHDLFSIINHGNGKEMTLMAEATKFNIKNL